MTDYFQKRSGLIGYSAGGSGYTDKLVTQMTLYGMNQWGSDAFWPVHMYDKKWYATLETGEIRLTQDGTKCAIYEVQLHTSIESNSTYTIPPDAIVQMIGAGDSSWTNTGDSNGTITVGTSYVTGTGTAWSNTIAKGNGATTVFTTPAAATKSRIYLNSTLQTLDTDYTITGAKEITFATAPTDIPPQNVIAYWTGQPRVLGFVSPGGYIETSYGLHRIIGVQTATQMTLEWYPPASSTGTHLPAQQLPTGEGETIFGLTGMADRVRFKIYIIPRTEAFSVRYIKDVQLSVVFTPSGTRQLEE